MIMTGRHISEKPGGPRMQVCPAVFVRRNEGFYLALIGKRRSRQN